MSSVPISSLEPFIAALEKGGIDCSPLPEEDLEIYAFLAKEGDRQARDRMVYSVVRLVATLTGRFFWSKIPAEDLFQAGMLAVVKSVNTYDSNRGVKFVSYAGKSATSAMLSLVEDQSYLIRRPWFIGKKGQLAKQYCLDYYEENGTFPKLETIQENNPRLSPSTIKKVLAIAKFEKNKELFGFDGIAKHFCEDLEDRRPQQDPWFFLDRAYRKKIVRDALQILDERAQKILMARSKGETFEEIAKQFKVTRERVRQIEARSLEKLAAHMGAGRPKKAMNQVLRETEPSCYHTVPSGSAEDRLF